MNDSSSWPDWAIGPFSRPQPPGPVIRPDAQAMFDCPMRKRPVAWRALHTFNPAAIVRNGKICLLFRAEDDSGAMKIGGHTSRLGLAVSQDGIHFDDHPQPVLYPDEDDQKEYEWDGGCEDPRIVESDDGTYVLTYTQWNRRSVHLAIATSDDLIRWRKHGPAFAGTLGGKYEHLSAKSAAILTKLDGGRLKAARHLGRYWMYFGEGTLHLAWSQDLVRWTPLEDEQGSLLAVMKLRPGFFDGALVEGGPPAILTDRGIVAIYNGRNAPPPHPAKDHADPRLPEGVYCGGQALFDPNDPAKLLKRFDWPFIKPEYDWERRGQYVAGTTFLQGLVYHRRRWKLYYGTADSFVAVAQTPEMEYA